MVKGSIVGQGQYRRGLNVAVLDQSTGALLSFQNYDTESSSDAANAFAAAIEELPVGRLVLIAVQEGAWTSFADRAKLACQSLGSARIFDIGKGGSWALIGQKGAVPGTRIESLSNTSAVSIEEEFDEQPANDGGFALKAVSAGYIAGGVAAILVNGQLVQVGYGWGMNVAIIDENTAQVLATGTYDTDSSSQASDQFAALLEGLPSGRVAMIVIQGGATRQLTERAKAACESMGSAQIRSLAIGGSWALIGVKDALIGGVCETLSNSSKACACSWLQPQTNQDTYFSLSAMSDYKGNTATLSIDDVAVPVASPPASRSFNVIVVSPNSGIVTAKGSFDIWGDSLQAHRLATFIYTVPAGWLVAAAVCPEGSERLNDNARGALRSIGSALIGNLRSGNSYAIIGCKGAAPGSVPEMLMTDSALSVSYRYPLTATRGSGLLDVRVYSAGFDVGNDAAITINGNRITMPAGYSPGIAGYSRGLNVALIDRNGLVEKAQVFDTCADSSASDAFAALIEGVPDGQVVAIAVKDDASQRLTERAKHACRSIGSVLIDQLGGRGSWAIVGAKGRAAGTAAEMSSNSASAYARSWVMGRVEGTQGFWIGAQSAGYNVGNSAVVLLNGKPVQFAGGTGRGLNVAVFDETSGALLSAQTYDINGSTQGIQASDAFAAMIESLVPGRMVAIAVKDDAERGLTLTPRARRACGLVGSTLIDILGFRGSWALIGMKGAAPGSALELVQNQAPAGIQTWMGINTPDRRRAFPVLPVIVVGLVVCLMIQIVTGIVQTLKEPDSFQLPPLRKTRRRGVFVGIDYDKYIPGLAKLNGQGSQLMHWMYRHAINLGYFDKSDTMLLLENQASPDIKIPSKQNIVQALQWLLKGAQDGDVLYFHYVGHGGKDTTVNPPYEYLITLNHDLTLRDVLKERELQELFAGLSPKVNLTCVFHCCFSGDMIDRSNKGRGIAIASTQETKSDTLRTMGANMTGVIGVKLAGLGQAPMPTYKELVDFINSYKLVNDALVVANPVLYNVNVLKFIEPLP
jgi:hypothetical protein